MQRLELNEDVVILDTETTGLQVDTAEICEIAIVDYDGNQLFNNIIDTTAIDGNTVTTDDLGRKSEVKTEPAPAKQPEPQPTTSTPQANIVDGVDQTTGEVMEPDNTDVGRTTEDWNIITDINNLVEAAKTKKHINQAQADSYDTAIADNFAGFDTENLTSTKALLVKLLNPS